jgi:TfoX N-terminal domain
MAYDKLLALRIRAVLQSQPNLIEKQMFGGVGFMLQGNMVCGVIGDSLISRVSSNAYSEALQKPHTHPFGKTGSKPMKGWVVVDPPGITSEEALRAWIEPGLQIAQNLPPKK